MQILAFSIRRWAALAGFALILVLCGCAGLSTAPLKPLTSPTAHSVYLSWNPSTSPDISGYNIYRAVYTNSCGSFSRINSELASETRYMDSAVANNTSYCYTTSAVNADKQESGFSEIIFNVQIPAN